MAPNWRILRIILFTVVVVIVDKVIFQIRLEKIKEENKALYDIVICKVMSTLYNQRYSIPLIAI